MARLQHTTSLPPNKVATLEPIKEQMHSTRFLAVQELSLICYSNGFHYSLAITIVVTL